MPLESTVRRAVRWLHWGFLLAGNLRCHLPSRGHIRYPSVTRSQFAGLPGRWGGKAPHLIAASDQADSYPVSESGIITREFFKRQPNLSPGPSKTFNPGACRCEAYEGQLRLLPRPSDIARHPGHGS
jgi:hypothetical protein